MANNQHAADIREKRNILRKIYGGMMTVTDIANELGYKTRDSALDWIREHEIPGHKPMQDRRKILYETDLIAKVIVDTRGMY